MSEQDAPMSLNDSLKLAAALTIHTKKVDEQLIRLAQQDITSLADAKQLNNALLLVLRFLLRDTSVTHVERLMGKWIDAINRDDAANT